MKRFPKLFGIIVLVAVIGFSLAGCNVTGVKSGNPVLTIQNNTGFTVAVVQISPSTDLNWGSDWLGSSEYFNNGTSKSFSLSSNGTYDVRLIDVDLYTYEKRNVQVNGSKSVTFTMSDGKGYLSVHNEQMDLLNKAVPDLPKKD